MLFEYRMCMNLPFLTQMYAGVRSLFHSLPQSADIQECIT